MERQEKIKIAITAGIAAVILLIMVLFLALSGKDKVNDEEKLAENIAGYAGSATENTGKEGTAALMASAEASDEAGTESSALGLSDAATAEATLKSEPEYLEVAKGHVSGNSFYATNHAVLKDVYKGVNFNIQEQLREISRYWGEGNTEAVRDLAHLERFEAMSYALRDSNDFYYYGDVDVDGIPNGQGVAVYANDQYYYGQWVNGKRSGDGAWFSFYPNYSTYVVKEHMYSGQWADDLPNGKGQEHYDYNPEHMNNADCYLQNIIGVFSQGYYNGSMYVITVDKNGHTTEWDGLCSNGNWAAVKNSTPDKNGNSPILSNRLNTDNHLYMSEKGSKNNGVSNLISGGNIRK